MTNVLAVNKDAENLNLLAVFHYVVGGIGFLFACFPVIHLVIGIMMLGGPGATRGDAPAPEMVGYLFIGIAVFLVLAGWTMATCTIISGRMIAKRRKRMFSFVVAAILCAFMPFGTVLGVFTLIVLNKESVKELYSKADVQEGKPLVGTAGTM